jgi:flagellar biosynthesis component FlhA
MQRCDDHLYWLSYVVEVSVATVSWMMAFVVDVLEEVTLGLSMSVCLCSLFSPQKKKDKHMSVHPTLLLDSI